jgi:N-acetylglutamate synthase-like GNAT family acetyltransferase
MEEKVQYYEVEKDGKLVAIASAKIDSKGLNAEMTDFAIGSEYNSNTLSILLLKAMEKYMKKHGILTLYTIARLNSL